MKTEIKVFCVAEKIATLKNRVSYYQNNYLPEIESYTGSNQFQHLDRAKKDLDDFLDSYKWNKLDATFEALTLNEKANFIRLYAIKAREQADNFKDSNLWIKWRELRACVAACNELRGLIPQLKLYSNHWLSIRKPIAL
jgi:hypothetical protein